MKISQLAELSGVSISTVKFYLREGLLPRPMKDSRTMSYYDTECVQRIQLIKRLQKERFMPLNIIKKFMSPDSKLSEQLPLVRFSDDPTENPAFSNPVARDRIEDYLGYPLAAIDEIEAAGLVQSKETPSGRAYDPDDCRIIGLIKQREEAGLPLEYSLKVLTLYSNYLKQAVEADLKHFLKRVVAEPDHGDIYKYLTVGENTTGAFLELAQAKYMRQKVESVMAAQRLIPLHIAESLNFRRLEESGRWRLETDSTSDIDSPLGTLLYYAATYLDRTTDRTGAQDTDRISQGIRHLTHGVFDLIEGRSDEALGAFESLDKNGPLGSPASALSGLACLVKTAQISGLTTFIDDIKKAVAHFNDSKTETPHPLIHVFSSYIRLVGFAVRPNFFDIGKDLQNEYKIFMEYRRRLRADKAEREIVGVFVYELELKAMYFMVLGYLENDHRADAEQFLKRMMDIGGEGFYSSWARNKLGAVGLSAAASESQPPS
ncbi:MAG: MerR family transcriptional regulator [Proteobacteria bacterium]|nr:MerR family transcriptional regulator [Pseudomonadota bacterium]